MVAELHDGVSEHYLLTSISSGESNTNETIPNACARCAYFHRSNNWSLPHEGQATTALLTPCGIVTVNALPQDVQSLFSVWFVGGVTPGKVTPPLLTLPETGVEVTTGLA